MDPLRQIQYEVHKMSLDSRAIDRILTSAQFLDAWASASDEGRAEVTTYLRALAKVKVEQWVEDNLRDGDNMSLAQLREKASRLGLPSYSKMSKAVLLSEIFNAETADKGAPRGDAGVPARSGSQA